MVESIEKEIFYFFNFCWCRFVFPPCGSMTLQILHLILTMLQLLCFHSWRCEMWSRQDITTDHTHKPLGLWCKPSLGGTIQGTTLSKCSKRFVGSTLALISLISSISLTFIGSLYDFVDVISCVTPRGICVAPGEGWLGTWLDIAMHINSSYRMDRRTHSKHQYLGHWRPERVKTARIQNDSSDLGLSFWSQTS